MCAQPRWDGCKRTWGLALWFGTSAAQPALLRNTSEASKMPAVQNWIGFRSLKHRLSAAACVHRLPPCETGSSARAASMSTMDAAYGCYSMQHR
jgi:hypothetical protein